MVLSGVSRRIGLVYRVSGVPVHLFPIGGSDFPDGIGSGPYGSRLARIPTGSAPLDTAMRHFYLYRAVVFNFLSPRCGSGDQGNVASCPDLAVARFKGKIALCCTDQQPGEVSPRRPPFMGGERTPAAQARACG